MPYLPPRRARARRGFTLIELIVVVIIIAVLAAIAAVAYNQYAAKARGNAVLASASSLRTAVMAASARDDQSPAAEVDALWTAAGGDSSAFLTALSASYTGPITYTPAGDGAPATLQVGTAAGGSHEACLSLPGAVSTPVTLTSGSCGTAPTTPVPTSTAPSSTAPSSTAPSSTTPAPTSTAPSSTASTSSSAPIPAGTSAPATALPAFAKNPPDLYTGSQFTLGTRFSDSKPATLYGVTFYKSWTGQVTVPVSVWSSTGTKLATTTYTGSDPVGFYTVTFTAPVPLTAGATYTISYVNATGTYATTNHVYDSGRADGTVSYPAVAGVDHAGATEAWPTTLPGSHADFAVYPYLATTG